MGLQKYKEIFDDKLNNLLHGEQESPSEQAAKRDKDLLAGKYEDFELFKKQLRLAI